MIKQGNLNALEEIVIQGHGDRLIGETSDAPLVDEFLARVPALLVSEILRNEWPWPGIVDLRARFLQITRTNHVTGRWNILRLAIDIEGSNMVIIQSHI